jgi:hypothetical protein
LLCVLFDAYGCSLLGGIITCGVVLQKANLELLRWWVMFFHGAWF